MSKIEMNNKESELKKLDNDIEELDDIIEDSSDVARTRKIETIAGLVILVVLLIVAAWMVVRKTASKEIKDASITVTADATDTPRIVATDNDTEEIVSKSVTDDKTVKLSDVAKADKSVTADELPQTYSAGSIRDYSFDDNQMVELYAYWDEYRMDAVNQLIRLDRIRKITDSLKGSSDFYYYGDKDSSGKPEGKGLAIYADNTYYFGDWKNGKREGSGNWLRIFPDEKGTVNGIGHVIAHSYNGIWKNDLPNGDGQEHFDYNRDEEIIGNMIILNAMGNFKDGYYDGDMLMMLLYAGNEVDFYGKLDRGTFEFIGDIVQKDGRRAILETDQIPEDNFFYLSPSDNSGFGIAGLKKG